MMFLAKELGKSLEEILDISTLEFRMWAAYYRYEKERNEAQQKTMSRKLTRG
jgi:hypothetical protein